MIEFIGDIELTQPHWLWLLPILLAGSLVLRKFGEHSSPASLATSDTDQQQQLRHPLISLLPKHQYIFKIPLLHKVMRGAIFIFFIIGLTEPVRIGEKLPDPPRERDIVFIVDSSISMTLRDYVLVGERIDRMTLLKGVLDRFIQKLPGERIGIIVFGDSAYTLVPLTRDQPLLRRMLSRVEATMAGQFNNIGEAIALAVKQTQQQGQRHRVLVILTDADKPTGSITPDTAAELARQAGLPLYTIAIGATTSAAEEQRATGLIYEPVNVAMLQSIAAHTGGRSFQAGDAQALEQAINDIAEFESNQRIVEPRYYREPLYLWLLLLGIATLVLLAVLPTHSTSQRKTGIEKESVPQ